MEKEVSPALIVIFGITGDLSRRKLLPALYHLFRDNLLHQKTQIVGVTRQNLNKADIVEHIKTYADSRPRTSETALREFESALSIFKMDMASGGDYRKLLTKLEAIEKKSSSDMRRLYYLSIPPAVFDNVIKLLGEHGLEKASAVTAKLPSLLIEKPFGYDLVSAKYLVKSTKAYFDERQIYRIDHYLAKEMAQNILAFRFGNPLFESIWHKDFISQVKITAYETIGIEGRSQFYEQTGALRDLIQSHLLQLMSLVAMEPPTKLSVATIHRARLKLLKNIIPPKAYEVASVAVRGQYAGYTREVNNPASPVETFAAVKLFINTPRWQGVPFILRTGKALHEKRTTIDVQYGSGAKKNVLSFRLQPDEGIGIGLRVKKPGHGSEHAETELDFNYSRSFADHHRPEAYERVLLDAIKQDQTLFATSDEVLAAWRIIQPIMNEWNKIEKGPKMYKKGSPGPLTESAWRKFINNNRGGVS